MDSDYDFFSAHRSNSPLELAGLDIIDAVRGVALEIKRPLLGISDDRASLRQFGEDATNSHIALKNLVLTSEPSCLDQLTFTCGKFLN